MLDLSSNRVWRRRLRVTVLGAGPSCPNPGGACAGYLFEKGETKLLLDCGPGVLGQLQKYVPYRQLSAVVITHLHPDHFFDLVPFRYGLKYGPYEGEPRRVPLYLPPEGTETLLAVIHPLDPSPTFFSELFQVEEFDPAEKLPLGDLTLRFAPVHHYVPTFAVAVERRGSAVFSSDTGPCDELVALAQGADLFLCEATLPRREGWSEDWGHLSAREAGEMAHRAGVKRLVLTHTWDGFDEAHLIEEARTVFGGPVEVAVEGAVYEV
jgi:ribonuclease BN (tRNA processing enzyme)